MAEVRPEPANIDNLAMLLDSIDHGDPDASVDQAGVND